jgi:hypothetical protein
MVAGRVSYKCYLRSTFAHADSGGFEKPPLRKHQRCVQPLMDKLVMLLVIWFTIVRCSPDSEEVILSQYSFGKHLVHVNKLSLTIEETTSYIKYTLIDDSSKLYLAPIFKIPTATDSIIYLEDLDLKLVDKKQFQIANSNYDVLKYEDSENEMTLFFNRHYGPIILRGNHYKGHETYDRPNRNERLLIEILRNDSIDFGGI